MNNASKIIPQLSSPFPLYVYNFVWVPLHTALAYFIAYLCYGHLKPERWVFICHKQIHVYRFRHFSYTGVFRFSLVTKTLIQMKSSLNATMTEMELF
jgi:hypothetical protein